MFTIHQELMTRPSYVEISRSAIRNNFNLIKKTIGKSLLLCVVKGNAYGHGSVEMAKIFQESGADYLGVAIPEEGLELRRAGIHIPILVLSAISDSQVGICIENNLTITAPSDEKIIFIENKAKELGVNALVHIKIDTGMGRVGVNWKRASKLFNCIKSSENIYFEGIFSHCAKSDRVFTKIQISRFNKVLNSFAEQNISFSIRHLANSSALFDHPDAHFDMVRSGLALFGYLERDNEKIRSQLEPAMSWKTELTYFKFVEKNTGIGYDHAYCASEDTRIITLPIGYADGYQRALGKNSHVLIKGKKYPVVGKICMDQMMVDIGRNTELYNGEEVILVGASGSEQINFFDLALLNDLSVYEILSQISYRVPRFYI